MQIGHNQVTLVDIDLGPKVLIFKREDIAHVPKKHILKKCAFAFYILLKNDMPVCKNIQWNNNSSDSENIKIINKELKFPLVVKPIHGAQGYGVRTDIKDHETLLKHINQLKNEKWNKVDV